MKSTHQITNLFIGLFLILFIVSLWYKEKYSMGVIYPYEISASKKDKSILIATQASTFKDDLTCGLIERLDNDKTYFDIIDITDLLSQHESMYNAIFIIHTWEMWRPPSEVKTFIESVSDKSKIYTIGTSGGGELMIEGVDGISSASTINNKDMILHKAVRWYERKVLGINDQTNNL